MEKGYFSAAWGDVTKSPGWFSKILRMALLCFIPVFGILVVYGYLYGWARDIAWNVHRPMPDKIFGNEDGNLYKRGFFILVIGFVFSLIPGVFSFLTSMVTGFSFVGAVTSSSTSLGLGSLFLGSIFSLVGFVLSFVVVFFYWVGAMRCALYGTLSSGFQFGKIWAMLRYDFGGILRIFGMSLICGVVVGIAAFIGIGLLVMLGVIFGFAFIQDELQAVIFAMVVLLLVLIVCIISMFVSVLVSALVSRALGYWTRQFQVNLWGGQEDPMPFELEQARQSQERYNAYVNQQAYQAGQQSQPYQEGWSAQSTQPQQSVQGSNANFNNQSDEQFSRMSNESQFDQASQTRDSATEPPEIEVNSEVSELKNDEPDKNEDETNKYKRDSE